MQIRLITSVLFVVIMTPQTRGQNNVFNDIHLFQTFFRDATTTENVYSEAGLNMSDFEHFNTLGVGARAAFPIKSQFEIGAAWQFTSLNPDQGDGESGFSDLFISGRYNFSQKKRTQLSTGGYLTLPIGNEKLGQGHLNIGAFGALRYPLSDETVLTAVLGLDFIERGDDRDSSLLLGSGIIHRLGAKTHIIGELDVTTEGDFALISGGVDYELDSGGRLRGALGLGVDDGAPDIMLVVGYHLSFD